MFKKIGLLRPKKQESIHQENCWFIFKITLIRFSCRFVKRSIQFILLSFLCWSLKIIFVLKKRIYRSVSPLCRGSQQKQAEEKLNSFAK